MHFGEIFINDIKWTDNQNHLIRFGKGEKEKA